MKVLIIGGVAVRTKVEGVLPEYNTDGKLLLICAKDKRAYMLQNRLKFY